MLIHTNFGSQENRLGRAASSNRNSCIIGILACLSISGLPCSRGFASKHLIMDRLGLMGGFVLLACFLGGRVLTILYSGKLLRILGRYTARQGSLGSAAVGSRGECPLWVNLLGGVVGVPCLGLTLLAPSLLTPTSPFLLLLFLSTLCAGVAGHRQLNSRTWLTFTRIGRVMAGSQRIPSTVPTTDQTPLISLKSTLAQYNTSLSLGGLFLLLLI